ncbi:MAG: DoxX family protein [Muribaculaceae bacterium]|nr:DoxX family protein [Muribaculaceae bacterium]
MVEVKRDRFLKKGFKVEVNIAILFLRFFVGFMMLTHAVDKIENFGDIAEGFPTPFGLNSWVALSLITFVEFVGSVFIIAGLFTRTAAILLALGMCTAAFFTFPEFFLKQSELALMYMGIYITLFITGGGNYSFDKFIKRFYKNKKRRNQ